MSDTIDLPAFGLTLRGDPYGEASWYAAGDWRTSIKASPCDDGRMYLVAYVGGVTHSCIGATLEEACSRLLASMSDEHVAAIRALGER